MARLQTQRDPVVKVYVYHMLPLFPSIAEDELMPTLEVGYRTGMVGIEYSGVMGTSYSTNDYPCPHNDYFISHDSEFVEASGVDLLLFIKCLYVGAGIYMENSETVATSRATGWSYL